MCLSVCVKNCFCNMVRRFKQFSFSMCRMIFLKFFASILSGYRNFIVCLRFCLAFLYILGVVYDCLLSKVETAYQITILRNCRELIFPLQNLHLVFPLWKYLYMLHSQRGVPKLDLVGKSLHLIVWLSVVFTGKYSKQCL